MRVYYLSQISLTTGSFCFCSVVLLVLINTNNHVLLIKNLNQQNLHLHCNAKLLIRQSFFDRLQLLKFHFQFDFVEKIVRLSQKPSMGVFGRGDVVKNIFLPLCFIGSDCHARPSSNHLLPISSASPTRMPSALRT